MGSSEATPLLLWKKKPSHAAPAAPPATPSAAAHAGTGPPEPAPEDELEPALETLAGIVRTIGRFAMDAPEASAAQVQELCEHWSQHLLILRPKPGDEPRGGTPTRDFRGLCDYIVHQRKIEQAHVGKAIDDTRNAVWAFIHGLNRALVEEAEADGIIASQLVRLRNTAQHGSLEELRRAAISAASSISDSVQQRAKRQRQRSLELGKQLVPLGKQLPARPRAATLDPLTELNDRPAFDDFTSHAAELAGFATRTTSLVLIDLDHFGQFNHRHGRKAGDEVLRTFSRCLVRTFLRKDDFLARYGGDEFAVVLPETELDDALAIAQRIHPALKRLEFKEWPELSISVSMGASALQPGDTVGSWRERAERALSDAQQGMRTRALPV
jgi:diguanylate cyclase (GGDEF)-like protein